MPPPDVFAIIAVVFTTLPVCRDVGYNANVTMDFLGPPDKIIAGFGPELFGAPLLDDDVTDTKVYKKGNDLYYQWDLKPHRKVVATATGNRVRSLPSTLACSQIAS